jgi:hypothetical protein
MIKNKIKEITTKGRKGTDENEVRVKIKLFLCFTKHQAMKTYGGVEV